MPKNWCNKPYNHARLQHKLLSESCLYSVIWLVFSCCFGWLLLTYVLCTELLLFFQWKKQTNFKLLGLTWKMSLWCNSTHRIRIKRQNSCICNSRADATKNGTLKFVLKAQELSANNCYCKTVTIIPERKVTRRKIKNKK